MPVTMQYFYFHGITAPKDLSLNKWLNIHIVILPSSYHFEKNISVLAHERDGVSNHRSINCLFYSLFRLVTTETWRLCITGHLCREFSGILWSPLCERSVIRKVFLCHNVIMRLACRLSGANNSNYCSYGYKMQIQIARKRDSLNN